MNMTAPEQDWIKKQWHGRVLKKYNDETHNNFRRRVESPFGGFAKRYHSIIEEQKPNTHICASLLWALVHNVRTLAKTLTRLNYWTVSCWMV
jgi:hypothetical protein